MSSVSRRAHATPTLSRTAHVYSAVARVKSGAPVSIASTGALRSSSCGGMLMQSKFAVALVSHQTTHSRVARTSQPGLRQARAQPPWPARRGFSKQARCRVCCCVAQGASRVALLRGELRRTAVREGVLSSCHPVNLSCCRTTVVVLVHVTIQPSSDHHSLSSWVLKVVVALRWVR